MADVPESLPHGALRQIFPEASDFERISAMQFQHLLPAHGTPLLHEAKSALQTTFARVFGPQTQ